MKRVASVLRVVVLAVLMGTLPGCSLFQQIADRFWPPATFVDQQYASVNDSLRQAHGFDASVGAFVSAQIIDDLVRNEVLQAVRNSAGDAIKIDQLEPKVTLVPQGIIVTVAFDGLELKNRVRIKGTLSGLAGIAVEDDVLLIRPALGDFKLGKLRTEGGASVNPDIAALVNAVVRKFASNAAGEFTNRPIRLKVGWSANLKANVDDLSAGSAATVDARNRLVQLRMAGALIHIDSKGLRVLGQVSANAAGVLPAAGPERSSAVGGPVSQAEFDRKFQQYSSVFEQRWQANLDPLQAGGAVEVYVARKAIAGLLNHVTDQKISLTYNYTIPATPFNEVVEAKKSQVDCQKVYKPFKRARYERASCSWNCQVCVWGMCTDDPVCKSNRALCNVKEEAKVLQDNIEWEAEHARHQVVQEAEVAACNVWRETTSVLSVGRFQGGFSTDGRVVATTAGVQVDPQLAHIDLKDFETRVSGRFDFDMKATPHDLGHVFFCLAPARLDYRGNYQAVVPTGTRRIVLSTEQKGDDLVLRAQLPPLDFQASVMPAPMAAFLGNKEFLAKCPVGSTVILGGVPAAKAASLLGLKEGAVIYQAALGQYKGAQELGTIEHRLVPQTVLLSPTRSLVVLPSMGPKAVILKAKAAQ